MKAPEGPLKYKQIICDISREAEAAEKLAGLEFDAVADFIAFKPADVERDYRLFRGKTRQFIFISSASAYQKPLASCRITEGTPLSNPLWEYSRQKIACEEFLVKVYREEAFPITIVRPSHTYDERRVPLGVHGKNGSWQVVKRIIEGKPVIIHGDGTSLWTMTTARDFATAFTGLVGNIHAIGEAVQITSDETLSWNQIYQAIADALEKPLKAVHVSSEFLAQAGPDYDFTGGLLGDKAVSVIFDNTKLKTLVPGFSASIRFDEGIRETIKYVLAHPELQVDDPDFDAFCDRIIAAQERALEEGHL
jgi:nucleoside-diphosphate-sugar epimerase